MYIKFKEIYMLVLSVLLAHFTFISISNLYFDGYNQIMYKASLVCVLAMLPKINAILKEEFRTVNIICLLICLSIFISDFISKGYPNFGTSSSNIFILKMITFMMFYEICIYENWWDKNLRIVLAILVFYCVISDIMIFTSPNVSIASWGEVFNNYLVGSKFNLSYMHFWIVILLPYAFDNKKLYVASVVWTALVSVLDACSTMIVGIAIYSLVVFFYDRIKALLQNRLFMCGYMLLCSVVLILWNGILETPFVKSILQNVLKESATLTGRLGIYEALWTLIYVNPLFGVGFDFNYLFSYTYTGAANYQNGLVDVYVSFGIIGLILLITAFVWAAGLCKKMDDKFLLGAIYMFISISSVEIVFRSAIYILFLFIGMLYAYTTKNSSSEVEV